MSIIDRAEMEGPHSDILVRLATAYVCTSMVYLYAMRQTVVTVRVRHRFRCTHRCAATWKFACCLVS